MAKQISYTLTDDLAEGAKLNSNQAVRVTVTDRDEVWIVDTARKNTTVAMLKSAGLKQAKRGRKPAGSTETPEVEQETPEVEQEGEAA